MSLLKTDGYKFSMAEAGWPLRRETFYFSHRKGSGIVPFDAEKTIRAMLPLVTPEDYPFLTRHDYDMGGGFKAAILDHANLKVHALPRGATFLPREPILSVTGPSALVSWLEPLVLQLHYRIQLATLALSDPALLAEELATVTCEEQRQIALETLDAVSVTAPAITVDSAAYVARVKAAAEELVAIVKDPGRVFEVGLRAATCVSQHLLALEGCKAAGVTRTSHVFGAHALGMIPVGTMGHEHIQRFGSDAVAFRAMRDRRPGRSSYLLDTFDTVRSGIPSAFDLIEEGAQTGDSIRYDSGDKEAQYRFAAAEAARRGIRPIQILEDSFDAPMTARFEELREEVGLTPNEQFYGYGGHLVAKTSGSRFTRDRVSAVFKLSQTANTPTMKFGDEAGAGKESVPGNPVVFRKKDDPGQGLIGQQGEAPPEGYTLLTGGSADRPFTPWTGECRVALSPASQRLADALRNQRTALLGAKR